MMRGRLERGMATVRKGSGYGLRRSSNGNGDVGEHTAAAAVA